MGKQKRARQKFHAVASKLNLTTSTQPRTKDTAPLLALSPAPAAPTENIFSGVDIDFNSLKKSLSDDTHSVRSYKSHKSEGGTMRIQPKKDKLKARREMLLKKIDTVNQMKKQLKIRKKRKNTALIGDTNPLHDALPSLESLMKPKSVRNIDLKTIKKKCIDKSARRKKQLVEGVKTFKQTLKNHKFKSNPLTAVTEHIKHIVQSETKFNKHNK